MIYSTWKEKCFVVYHCDWVIINFTHMLQGYFTYSGAVIWLPQCQWGSPEGYGQVHVSAKNYDMVECCYNVAQYWYYIHHYNTTGRTWIELKILKRATYPDSKVHGANMGPSGADKTCPFLFLSILIPDNVTKTNELSKIAISLTFLRNWSSYIHNVILNLHISLLFFNHSTACTLLTWEIMPYAGGRMVMYTLSLLV